MGNARFGQVEPQVSFPELEERVLRYWEKHGIVSKGLAANEGAEEYVFYEGPPTANGRPHIGHVETRAFKDIFPRFRTMRGYHVPRKAGWDCHGLPVELEVERELGINSKREIEDYGVMKFNALCRESVKRYVDDWSRLTERIGFWLNTDDAYWTMSPSYVESVWWSLKKLYDEGLLFQDYRSAPYCPRCETGLSRHEQDQPDAYKTVSDPSVFVRLPLTDEPEAGGADLLIWTTTPWTLPSNLAAAVHPDVTYVKVATEGRPVIVAQELADRVLGEGQEILGTLTAADLVGRSYEPPFRYVDPTKEGKKAWIVVAEDFVTITDGTGVVHIAPAYGAEDLEAGKKHGLPFVNLVDPSGRFLSEAGELAGLGIKDADPVITADLQKRGILFREELYEHNYPHCWRCKTPLIYYAKTSWYVRTTARKQDLLDQNAVTNWYPETIRDGRYGEWLRNNIDWALSRDRYWGTPLPIWRCQNSHDTVVGSLKELSHLAGRDLTGLDPHRPFVDEVTLDCPACGSVATRVPEVIDAWYDSGSMPFGQWGYPYQNTEIFESRFPADFIAEAIDQTRGWFYTLMATSTLLFGQSSYRNVLCLGHIVAPAGKKLSKSEGGASIQDPWAFISRFGADPLRWWMFTSGTPWVNRAVSPEQIEELVRRYFITLWNTYSFFVTYANIDGFDPSQADEAATSAQNRPEIDRWILSELHECIREVTEALDTYDALRASRRIDALVDDLSNWYVRRSRRRFWRSGSDEDKTSAYLTLYECLVTLAKLTAPFTPFISEEIFTNLTGRESVHLESWPEFNSTFVDEELMERVRTARVLVSLGRAARNDARVRTRQPLNKALVVVPREEQKGLRSVTDLVIEELNVKRLEVVESLEELVIYSVKPNFRALGPRLGPKVKVVADTLAVANTGGLVSKLESSGSITLEIGGEYIELTSDELEVRAVGKPGFGVATEGPYAVAMDLEVTKELKLEGLAREAVRAVQEARKEAGFDIADRIELSLSAPGELGEAIENYREWIASETLAVGFSEATPSFTKQSSVDGETLNIGLTRTQQGI